MTGRWQLQGEAQPQRKRWQLEEVDRGTAFGRGLADGLTLSWGDEARAGIEGALAAAQGGDFSQAYQRQLATSRGNLEAAQQAHPWTTGAGELTGVIGSSLVPGGVQVRGAGLAGRLGLASAVGAGFGGTYAAGSTNTNADNLMDDLAQRAPNALQGAALGAALGGGFQGVFEGAPALWGAARRAAGLPTHTGRMGVAERAQHDLMTSARQNERLGVQTPADLTRVMGEAAARDPSMTVAEALGRSAINRVVGYSRLPGRTAERAEQLLERNADTFGALTQRLDDTLTPRAADGAPLTMTGAGGELDAAFAQASAHGYQDAFRHTLSAPHASRLQGIVQRHPEFYDRAIQEAQIIARGEGITGLTSAQDPRFWHFVKVAAGDVVRSMRREGLGATRARQYTQSLRQLVDELDQVPGYRTARQQWGSLSEAREAMEAGFAFDRMRPQEMTDLVARLTPFQQRYLQAGVAERIRDTLARRDTDGLVNIARDLTNRRRGDLLRAAFGDRRGPLDDFLEYARLRRQMHADASRMASSRESPTGIVMGEGLASMIPTGAISLRAMGMRAALDNTVGKLGQRNRDVLGRVLLTPVGQFDKAGRGLLSRAQREMARRQARTRLRRTRGAIYSGAGSAGIVDARLED